MHLSTYGRFLLSPEEYAALALRVCLEVGDVLHVSIQDWMCEPFVLAKTGLTLREHQARTIDSYCELSYLQPGLPWVPVLQGMDPEDYLRHFDDYARAGIDLTRFPLVGVGSVCKRNRAKEIRELFVKLHELGLRLHGFGVKADGLASARGVLASADSMAWSRRGRFAGGRDSNGYLLANSQEWAEHRRGALAALAA
jgi:hypothetical protein